jgi:hypothetical protein
VESRKSGRGLRCSWWLRWRLSGSVATVEVGGHEMRAPLFINRPEVGDGRDTCDIAITSCAEVDDGHAPSEASSFTRPQTAEAMPRRQYWRRWEDASNLGHCQAGPTKRPSDASGHFARPRIVRRDASEAHIWARFASPRMARSLCIASLEEVPYVFSARPDAKRPFASPR